MTPDARPTLVAQFVLDETGKPVSFESRNNRHYKILLKLLGTPTEVQSVTYKLDESYWNPEREVFRSKPGFEEAITAFGDYRLVASLSGSKQAGLHLEDSLADLLERSVPPNANKEAVEQALNDLREH